MSTTFLGIETAKRSLAANQVALNITGNNIANISTEGYTRQRVDTVSMSAAGQSARYAISQASLAGQGVAVNGIGQIRDAFLDKRYRAEAADTGYYERATEIMTDIETALDEYSSTAMKDAMAELFKAFNDLSKNADQAVNANIVLTAAKGVVQVLNNFDAKLNDIRDQQIYGLQVDVDDFNTTLKRIADLNHAINQEIFASSINTNVKNYGPNELLDERNLLLDKLAKYADITVDNNADGSVKVVINGHEAVNGTTYERLNLNRYPDNTVSLTWMGSGEKIFLESGSIQASLNMINGRGTNATGNESYEKGIRYFEDMINSFASNLMTEFNRVLPVKSTGSGPVEYKNLFSSGGDNLVTAKNIAISSEWMSDPSYIIDEYVDADGSFDNTYILSAISLFDKNLRFQGMNGTFEEYINFYNTSEIGQQVFYYQNRLETSTAVSNALLNERDSVSAVSLDEEGANLMQYQKAYNAMARLMTALDEALDTLINRTGVIGR